jgi:hypothetical protein
MLHRDDQLISIAPKLPPNHNLWFQQDGAMAHTAVINLGELHCLFLQQVIFCSSDVTWPPCSPDLTAPDFFCRGYLKSKMYCSCPVDLSALKQTIRDESSKFRRNTLKSYTRVLNSCAPLYSGGWWPPRRHCTQEVKHCKHNLSTIVNFIVLNWLLVVKCFLYL